MVARASHRCRGEMRSLAYGVVTTVRDDAVNLERLGRCLIAQSRLPLSWLIVDQGSTDASARVGKDFARRHDWVEVVTSPGPARPTRGAPIAEAFELGVAALPASVEIVVRIDADVSMDEEFCARLVHLFESDDTLGIASGSRWELEKGVWRRRFVVGPSVEAQCRAYRRACLTAVLPLDKHRGWDGVDVVQAELLGWGTLVAGDLGFRHHRAIGARDGSRLRAWPGKARPPTRWDIACHTSRSARCIAHGVTRGPSACWSATRARLSSEPEGHPSRFGDTSEISSRRSTCANAPARPGANESGSTPTFCWLLSLAGTCSSCTRFETCGNTRPTELGHAPRHWLAVAADRRTCRVRSGSDMSQHRQSAAKSLGRLAGHRSVSPEADRGDRIGPGRAASLDRPPPRGEERLHRVWRADRSPVAQLSSRLPRRESAVCAVAGTRGRRPRSTVRGQHPECRRTHPCGRGIGVGIRIRRNEQDLSVRSSRACALHSGRRAVSSRSARDLVGTSREGEVGRLPPLRRARRSLSGGSVVVTHGGIGSVLLALSVGKRPIVMPRCSRLGEHVDDHQIAFAERLEREQRRRWWRPRTNSWLRSPRRAVNRVRFRPALHSWRN